MNHSKATIRIDVLRAAKAGEKLADSEDVVALPRSDVVSESALIGLADGASESAESKLWGQILAGRYVMRKLDFAGRCGSSQIAECRLEWRSQTESRLLKMPARDEFFARQRRDDGACATFAGIEIIRAQRRWRGATLSMKVQTIGDSCVVLHSARGGDLAFPADPVEYAGRPHLVGSLDGNYPPALCKTVPLSSGDTILMATDAFARWYLGEEVDAARARRRHLATIRHLMRHRGRPRSIAFRRWLDAERASGRLENDDVTIVWVEIGRPQSRRAVNHAGH